MLCVHAQHLWHCIIYQVTASNFRICQVWYLWRLSYKLLDPVDSILHSAVTVKFDMCHCKKVS